VHLRELPAYQRTPSGRFRGWLWTVLRNRVRALRRQRLRGNDLGPDEPAAPDYQAEREATDDLALLARRAAEILRTDFQHLTWKAFWETAVAGRSGKEVAQELGMTIGAVYAARFRVPQRIREELADFFD
jgi:RNA polymerase sigma-70 factor (ECF subfamily)